MNDTSMSIPPERCCQEWWRGLCPTLRPSSSPSSQPPPRGYLLVRSPLLQVVDRVMLVRTRGQRARSKSPPGSSMPVPQWGTDGRPQPLRPVPCGLGVWGVDHVAGLSPECGSLWGNAGGGTTPC